MDISAIIIPIKIPIKKHFKNFFSCVNNLLLMIFQQLFKKMVSLLDFTHQKIFGLLVEGFNERN